MKSILVILNSLNSDSEPNQSHQFYIFTPLTDIRDDAGQSPLDIASVDVALYLINHGAGDDKDKAKLLCRACELYELDIVKELVEENKLDPNGKYYNLYTCIHVA